MCKIKFILESGAYRIVNKNTEIQNAKVAAVYQSFPKKTRKKLLHIRRLILKIASETDTVPTLLETLKWGEPSYITHNPKTGTTIRLTALGEPQLQLAICVHCQTTLIDQFKEIYGTQFKYDGNRCILFDAEDDIPMKPLSFFIQLALTYFIKK